MIKCSKCNEQTEIYNCNLFSKREINSALRYMYFQSSYQTELLEKIFFVYCNKCFFGDE